MRRFRLLLALAIVLAIAAFFALDLARFLHRDYFLAQRDVIQGWRAMHPWLAATAFVALYIAVASLSLPGALPMTLAGGALFGLALGTLLVSFASSIGATLACLAARFILRDWVQTRFGDRLAAIDEGMRREGAFYLFALRLVPVFPFFVINLLMGLTAIPVRTFYWVSQLGMLPATLVYVVAGTQLEHFQASFGLFVAFALLGVFPLIARRALDALKARRVYAGWPRPAKFDYNLVVIGAGSAGLVSAYIGTATRARVALIERDRMGGDCLNTGCVPSKALIRAARLSSQIAHAGEFGITASGRVDFAQVMERVARTVQAVEPHDSVERYSALGVDCIRGNARLTSPWTVEVDDVDGDSGRGVGGRGPGGRGLGERGRRTLTTRAIVIASGARAFVPPIPGLQQVGYLTSDTLWALRELPVRLVVLGGGPVGSELAQAFARLGSQVTQVEMLPRILAREDPDVSQVVTQRFEQEGIRVWSGHTAREFLLESGRKILVAERGGTEVRVEFDQLLVAVGRAPRTDALGLEALGIETGRGGTIQSDEFLRTRYPNITVCGDVAGPYQFTHTASHQAWYATVNALFGRFRTFRADYRVIPWTTFVDPEVARVGINEQEARERRMAHDVTVYSLSDLDRALADGDATGFVKVLTRPASDRILGVTIVGAHAGELLAEFVLAMKQNIGLNRILGTIHAYPTLAEANRNAAGQWRRAQVTRGQWTFLEALQAWLRGARGLAAVIAALAPLVRDRRKAYAPQTH
ncbi:MAG TPA: FAD-dependent oxidoreductase [Burkholderiaceae bacterium]|nr:FAD-dependent oxidoreductase [Burkholderiaceae bacterium]